MGVNSANISGVGSYYTTVNSIAYTGNGEIATYTSDAYLQNQTISKNTYISGKNIYVNNITVKTGCTLMLDAESEVLLDKNVDVPLNANLEIVKQ